MDEIVLISFLYLVASVFTLAAGIRMFFITKEKEKSVTVRYFFYGLIFIAGYFFINGLLGFYGTGTFPAFVLVSFFRPFLLIGGMFFCLIPFNLLGAEKAERIYTYTALFVVLVSSFLSYLEITRQLSPEGLIAKYGMGLTGIFFIASLLFAGLFYFRAAVKKRENKVVMGRSIMIGMGCVLFALGATSKYVVGVLTEDVIGTGIPTSLLFIVGSMALAASITYRGERSK